MKFFAQLWNKLKRWLSGRCPCVELSYYDVPVRKLGYYLRVYYCKACGDEFDSELRNRADDQEHSGIQEQASEGQQEP